MKTSRPNHEAVSLQEILTRLNDSISGFRLAADFSTDSAFIRLCERTAEAREGMAEELAAVIAECGGEPSLEGSREASIHRAWIRFVCHVHPQFRKRLHAECGRGEGEFQRTLGTPNRLVPRNERTALMLADLSAHVEATLASLRRVESSSRAKAQPHYAAAA